MYNFAAKHGVKYILTGANFSTECVKNPIEWHYHASDLVQLKDIHRKFGTVPLNSFPLANVLKYKVFYRFAKGVRVVKPLDYVPYIKSEAMAFLIERFGWQPYPQKHFESRFTKFYEGFWLPEKFGFDKRKVQYSSLILTKQMSREEALDKLAAPPYDETTIDEDFDYVASKLDISTDELRSYLRAPNKSYRDYKSQIGIYNLGVKVLSSLGVERRVIR
jgi:hypothetical protein